MVDVRPDDWFPVNKQGVRAEMIMDPTSIPGRMNPSNLYEQYFNGISRRIKYLVSSELDKLGGVDNITDETIENIFSIVTTALSYFGTEQYAAYCDTNIDEKREILTDIYEKEMYIYYKVSSDKKPHEIVTAIRDTEFAPVEHPVLINTADSTTPEWTKKDVLIAPQYIILLAKTPEHYLATASAKTNHYDMPVSVGPKMRQNVPSRNSPVKILSETETRLYSSYVGDVGLAEMKDRANSVETHKLMYKNILDSDVPTNIDTLIDRDKHPYGTDKAIEIIESMLNASGVDIVYHKEK